MWSSPTRDALLEPSEVDSEESDSPAFDSWSLFVGAPASSTPSEESASPTFDAWSLVAVAPESSSPTEESASPILSGQSAEE